jgi:hypothetical protein
MHSHFEISFKAQLIARSQSHMDTPSFTPAHISLCMTIFLIKKCLEICLECFYQNTHQAMSSYPNFYIDYSHHPLIVCIFAYCMDNSCIVFGLTLSNLPKTNISLSLYVTSILLHEPHWSRCIYARVDCDFIMWQLHNVSHTYTYPLSIDSIYLFLSSAAFRISYWYKITGWYS